MEKRKTILVAALLAALPCLCFWEVFRGDLLLPTDWLHQDLEPWRQQTPDHPVLNSRIKDAILDGFALDVVSARAAQEGRIALWNPYAGGGVPHLAAGFSRMLYPPFWIYAFLGVERAHNVEILLHLLMAEFFAFVFLRRLGMSLTGSILGAVVYGFTPSITHRAEISFILPSLVWFPLLLTFVDGLVTTARPRFFAGLAITVAFQVLAGHYPDIFINILGATVYGLVRLAVLRSAAVSLRRGLLAAGAALLGASLAAPFLLPSLELIGRANRPLVSATELSETGLGPGVFLTLFSPSIERSQLYIGLLPLLFLPAAVRRVPRGPTVALLASFLAGIGISTGSAFFDLLHSLLPGLENLRYLGTHVALASFSLALLAGIGISERLPTRMGLERVLALFLLAGGAITGALAWLWGQQEVLTSLRLPAALGLVALAWLAMELKARGRMALTTFAAIAGAAITLDLFSYARAFNPRVDADVYPPFPDFPAIQFLRNDPDTFRVATLLGNYYSPFWPNTLGAYGIEDVGAYHSLLPQNLGSYVQRIRRYTLGITGEELLEEQDPSNNWIWLSSFRPSNLLRNWNIKYFILPAGWPNPDPAHLELVYDDEVRLFLYRARMPRAWLAEQAVVLPGERGIYARLLDPTLGPDRTVLLRTEPACYFPRPAGSPAAADQPSAVRIVDYRPESMVIETSSPMPSYLVLSESYDPGWHARVDGESVTVLEANLYFRALPLPAGAHRVELFYRPASYVWGWRIFGLSLALLVLGTWLSGTRLSEGSMTTLLVGSTVAVAAAGLLGWRGAKEVSDPRRCGQLQVAERLFPRSSGSFVRLGPLAVEGVTAPLPAKIPLPVRSSSSDAVARVFIAAGEETTEIQASVAALTEGRDALPLAELNPWRRRERWVHLEAPLPSGTEKLLLEASSTHLGEAGSVVWGNPLVLEPRPRRPSKVCFLVPGVGARTASLPSDEEEARLKILLTMRDRKVTGDFDEIHFASDEPDFSTRMLALAPTLYRRMTFLVLEPAPQQVAERQLDLLKRELSRLGLGTREVVVETCGRDEAG